MYDEEEKGRQISIKVSPDVEPLIDAVYSEMVAAYNHEGVSWPVGKMKGDAALFTKFFYEGMENYGVEYLGKDQARLNKDIFLKRFNRNKR